MYIRKQWRWATICIIPQPCVCSFFFFFLSFSVLVYYFVCPALVLVCDKTTYDPTTFCVCWSGFVSSWNKSVFLPHRNRCDRAEWRRRGEGRAEVIIGPIHSYACTSTPHVSLFLGPKMHYKADRTINSHTTKTTKKKLVKHNTQ